MVKKRLLWIIVCLTILIVIFLILLLPGQNDLLVGETTLEQLPKGQYISAMAYPESYSVQKGDSFLYIVKVIYNADYISEIDGTNLDSNVDLEPFEIRNIKEMEYTLSTGVKVYQKQYEIQLISGDVKKLYEFPTIVVRYKLINIDGYAESSAIPEPVYVAARLPDSITSIINDVEQGYAHLYPVKGEAEEEQSNLLWIFWVLGIILVLLAVIDFILRVIPQFKQKFKQTDNTDKESIFYQAYRSVNEKIVMGVQPKELLHQVDKILRIILVKKENFGWLEEPNLKIVTSGIQTEFISLFEKCQSGLDVEDIHHEEVEEILKQLEDILKFYFPGEPESWKR